VGAGRGAGVGVVGSTAGAAAAVTGEVGDTGAAGLFVADVAGVVVAGRGADMEADGVRQLMSI
jgi:hypothetical protein